MILSELVTAITDTLLKVTDRLLAIPANATLMVGATNTTGMQFMSGIPMALFPLATSAADVTALQAATADFLDVRTSTYWTKATGSWVSSAYIGDKPFLRISSLVMGSNNSLVYYFATDFTCHLADTTTPST